MVFPTEKAKKRQIVKNIQHALKNFFKIIFLHCHPWSENGYHRLNKDSKRQQKLVLSCLSIFFSSAIRAEGLLIFVRPSLREDTHKKIVFFSDRTTKGVGRLKP